MQRKFKFKTIRSYAEHLLTKTDFVDCHGRRVGLDYPTILGMIRKRFPRGHTSIRSLRQNVYTLDPATRLPVRRKSRKLLAREYARTLLMQRDSDGRGLPLASISRKVKAKFRDTPFITRTQLALMLPALRREFRSRLPGARG